MNTEQAIKILEQALNASAKAGVFNLQDSSTINMAMEAVKQAYYDTLDAAPKESPVLLKEEKSKK